MRPILLGLLLVVAIACPVQCGAQVAEQNSRLPVQLDTISISGAQLGPGMWRVSDGIHVLWIMGAFSPVPKDITWNSKVASKKVLESQEVIWEPAFRIDTDAGFFEKLYLGFRFYQATKNPDGKTLKEVLQPDLYARWTRLKQLYLPTDGGVERRRPMLAAAALLEAALKRQGLTTKRLVEPMIAKLVENHHIKSTRPTVSVTIQKPAEVLKNARKISLNDEACLEATLDTIENDLPRIVANANAWAVGEIESIDLAGFKRRQTLCEAAFSGADFSRKLGIPDIEESGKARWVSSAETALKKNQQSFSVVPLQDVLGTNGYLARLAAKGYQVTQP